MANSVYIGNQPFNWPETEPQGEFCLIGGEKFYKLTDVDKMRPFFMSIVSSDNHWMFVSSNKGMSAGRVNSDSALFPYYTDDKITSSAEDTGSKTLFLVHDNNSSKLWEPYSDRFKGSYKITRNLYKNNIGGKLIFEEINHDLDLTFLESWSFSNSLGIVKTSEVRNNSNEEQSIHVVDGIQNIIPANVSEMLQSVRSNLADAYKINELVDNNIGVFSLSARIVDRAIPSESLRASTVWSTGIEPQQILLSSRQLENFRRGAGLDKEESVRAEKGAYFVSASLDLKPNETKTWHIVAEVEQSSNDLEKLRHTLATVKDLDAEIRQDIMANNHELLENIAKSDGLQKSNDDLVATRHLNNVVFNIMRGGFFKDDYLVDKTDFLKSVEQSNKQVYDHHVVFLTNLPANPTISELKELVAETNDLNLIRLTTEYLPLSFSRRHGDPSRPWNRFNIITRDEEGNALKYYEGNWRDIFQNWEALALSYPEYLENMLIKFLNASTIDGYNPYRISSNGIDWEVVEPDDPWSYIGYWGDHQLIYFLKLAELYEKYYPGKLLDLLSKNIGVYANVPYKLKPFKDILANPQDTIDFDFDLAEAIDQVVEKTGSDGKLIFKEEGTLLQANIMEKILVSVLAKVSNFIPDAGIWMNTQRPEWNDANNALVGNGVSMVTLYQLRRYLKFLEGILSNTETNDFEINAPVADLLNNLSKVFAANKTVSSGSLNPQERYEFVVRLGEIGEDYRTSAYKNFAGTGLKAVSSEEITSFAQMVCSALDQTIKANKREDGLYHAYNIISFKDSEAIVDHLEPMLEGQVNILASGYLDSTETLDLLTALPASSLYRADQDSYLLYPDKQRATFVERNNISDELLQPSKLVRQLREDKIGTLVQFDVNGRAHFKADIHNAEELGKVLDRLAENPAYKAMVAEDRDLLLEVHEKVFNHKEFTGRSGTFYGYEGLGSIYWHMVSKLVESVGEIVEKQKARGDESYETLVKKFHKLKDGIGVHKTPTNYGAIPTDPYSHTPGNKGVQQPGMTGQVKEDILSRYHELGMKVTNGEINFSGGFFTPAEYLNEDSQFDYFDLDGTWKSLDLRKGSLAFTCCQVPIVYEPGDSEQILVAYKDGSEESISGTSLSSEVSKSLFSRAGKIKSVRVQLGS